MVSVPLRWRKAICASELSASSRLVAHVLATHMNAAGGSCFPGMSTIARESGLTRRSVIRAVKDLEKHGYIAVTERGGTKRSGKPRSNAYEARFPLPSDTVTPVSPRHRCPDDTHPVTPGHRTGDTVTPEVVMKLSIEQGSRSTKPNPNGDGPNPEGARKAREMRLDLRRKIAMASADP